MRHWKKVQPKMKVSAGYEFVEWAQGADLNNNEFLEGWGSCFSVDQAKNNTMVVLKNILKHQS